MANVTIDGLTAKAVPESTDQIEIQEAAAGASKKATLGNAVQKVILELGQIPFPATQVASADPNTLDDYEEGTWSAAMTASTSGTITLNASFDTGRYTKVGRLVTVGIFVRVSSVSSPVGNLAITGLPFTSNSTTDARVGVAIWPYNTAAPANTMIVGKIPNNSTEIQIDGFSTTTAAAAGYMQANTELYVSAQYIV